MRRLWGVVLTLLVLGPVPALAQTETVEYYGLDALGSVRVVFDPTGAVVGRMDYAPFGEELYQGLFMPAERFAQLTRDGEAGLDYAQARMYQPRTGRFNAPDPVYPHPSQPQLWNRYSYSFSSPTSHVDPSGEFPVGLITAALNAAAAAAAGSSSDSGLAAGDQGMFSVDEIHAAEPERFWGGFVETFRQELRSAAEVIEQLHQDSNIHRCETSSTGLCNSDGSDVVISMAGAPNIPVGAAAIVSVAASQLARASQAALNAASNAQNFVLQAKHAAGAGGGWSQFARGVDPNAALQQALASPNARFLPNDSSSFKVITDLGYAIGSKGQTAIRAIVDYAGHVVTWFPVRP